MSSSLNLIIVHAVFSTKERAPLLTPEVQDALFPYMAGVTRNLNCECYRIGGYNDHVHLAIRLSKTLTSSDFISKVKTSTSKWLKSKGGPLSDFSWQRGYGAFSVGPKDLHSLIAYIDQQEAHHQKKTFKDEFRQFLDQYGMEYDERYIWG